MDGGREFAGGTIVVDDVAEDSDVDDAERVDVGVGVGAASPLVDDGTRYGSSGRVLCGSR